MKSAIPYIIIGIILVFIFQRECTRPGGDPGPADTVTITKIIPGDSIPYSVEIIKHEPYPVYVDCTVVVPADIDTLAILQDYYRKYYYDDTLMADTSAYIRLMAHTFRNTLVYDSLIFQNRRKTAINTTIITPLSPEKPKVYAGLGTTFGTSRLSATGNILVVVPKGYALSGGFDFINKEIIFTGYIPIRFKRR